MKPFKVLYRDQSGALHSQVVRGESAEIVHNEFTAPGGGIVEVISVKLYTFGSPVSDGLSMQPVAL